MKTLLSEQTLSLMHADAARRDGERRAQLDYERGELVRDLRLDSFERAADVVARDATPVAWVADYIAGYRSIAVKLGNLV